MAVMYKALAAFAALVAISTAPAQAISVGGGWNYDQVDTLADGGLSNQSIAGEYDNILITEQSVLTVTDGFQAGDSVRVTNNGSDIGTTSFQSIDPIGTDTEDAEFDPLSPFPIPDTDPDAALSDALFGSVQILLTPGSYNLAFFGDGAVDLPQGFFLRIDTVQSLIIPLPAPILMLLSGLALLGLTGRRRTA
ncbi:MAG: hypothetical protein AAFP23_07045 [Pseudomonadota bacterium]